MVPAGSGVALSDTDRQFIARVAEAVEGAMAAQGGRFSEAGGAGGEGARERRRALQRKLEVGGGYSIVHLCSFVGLVGFMD